MTALYFIFAAVNALLGLACGFASDHPDVDKGPAVILAAIFAVNAGLLLAAGLAR